MTILVVEDNIKVRSFITEILAGWGHTTIVAANGVIGVESFNSNQPDVVLMDIQMDEMDGIEAARRIRNTSADARIIMVTDYNDASFRKKAKEAGANDYVLKENILELKQLLE